MASTDKVVPIEEKDGNDLDGLRTFLDDWNSGKGPERERDEKAAKARRGVSQAHIYSSYLKQAEQADKDLLGRWTETSNIVLVFSGLQSAIVVAFIIFAETSSSDLNPSDLLLQSLLYRLDNSTMLQGDSRLLGESPSVSIRTSACWYASLACSLLSAFGGLLSKQWAIHYAGRPLWANTTTLQCRLREMRHTGLERWKLGWLIDSLISLLQLSVLVFAIGLIFHLHNTSFAHFAILLSFTAFGAAFFVFTTIAGAFIPPCPFKSSVTDSLYRASMFLVLMLPFSPLACLLGLFRFLSMACRARRLIRWTSRAIAWCEVWIGRGDAALVGGNAEQRRIEHSRAGTIGILCQWLVQDAPQAAEERVDIKEILEEITSLPPRTVVLQLNRKQSFMSWTSKVLNNLQSITGSSSPYQDYHLQMGDLLCHFMHRIWWARIFALRFSRSAIYNPSGEFCAIMRGAWCKARQTDVLPIPQMQWTTVSLYFVLQVQSWIPLWQQGWDGPNRDELHKDLLVLLDDPRLDKQSQVISNATVLAAHVLVEGNDRIGDTHMVDLLYLPAPAEVLLQGLHLLSNYPTKYSPTKLVLSVVRVSADRISSYLDDDKGYLTKSHCWKNGGIAGTLLRLLRLGYSWRSQEMIESVELGEKLTKEVQRTMSRVLAYLITTQLSTGWFILSSTEGLTTALETYAHPSTISPLNLDALRIIDFVLGLRYHSAPSRATLYLPWIKEDGPSTRPKINLPNILTDHPHILTQLISDIERSEPFSEERRIILSVLVKGRDIFFLAGDKSLQEALDSAGTLMMQSRNILKSIEDPSFLDFNRWGEVVAFLKQQEQEYLNLAKSSGATRQGSVLHGGSDGSFLDV